MNKGQGGDAKERQKKKLKIWGRKKLLWIFFFHALQQGRVLIFVHLFWADASCESEGNESGLYRSRRKLVSLTPRQKKLVQISAWIPVPSHREPCQPNTKFPGQRSPQADWDPRCQRHWKCRRSAIWKQIMDWRPIKLLSEANSCFFNGCKIYKGEHDRRTVKKDWDRCGQLGLRCYLGLQRISSTCPRGGWWRSRPKLTTSPNASGFLSHNNGRRRRPPFEGWAAFTKAKTHTPGKKYLEFQPMPSIRFTRWALETKKMENLPQLTHLPKKC